MTITCCEGGEERRFFRGHPPPDEMPPPTFAPGQFSWVDLMATDLHEALGFYQAVFSWEVVDVPHPGGEYVHFTVGGARVAGAGQLPAGHPSPPMWASFVTVTDAEATCRDVRAHGGGIVVHPTDIHDQGRMALVTDPEGAPFGLWEPRAHRGADLIHVPGSLIWNELNVRDTEQARAFYGAVFGWTYELNHAVPSGYWFIRLGEGAAATHIGGMMRMTEQWEGLPPHWIVYFCVSDIAAAVGRVTRAGGRVLHGPFDSPIGPLAVVSDPAGGVFMLMEPTPEPSVVVPMKEAA